MKNNSLRTKSLFATAIIAVGVLSTSSASALSLYRQLQIGMSGPDVAQLQTFLASNPSIYPEGKITGYFGALTSAAVRRYQALKGIFQVGRVGPQTLAALNAEGTTGSVVPGASMLSNVTVQSGYGNVTVNFTGSEPVKGKIFYSTSPLQVYETETDVIVTGAQQAATDVNPKTAQSVVISGLSSNTNYYYMIYVMDNEGNVTVSVPWKTFRSN